jgi:hypothetical protein
MTDQELKNKYQPVADFMSRNGFNIQHSMWKTEKRFSPLLLRQSI